MARATVIWLIKLNSIEKKSDCDIPCKTATTTSKMYLASEKKVKQKKRKEMQRSEEGRRMNATKKTRTNERVENKSSIYAMKTND